MCKVQKIIEWKANMQLTELLRKFKSSFVTGGPGGGIRDAPSLSLSHIISITFLGTNFHQLIVEED